MQGALAASFSHVPSGDLALADEPALLPKVATMLAAGLSVNAVAKELGVDWRVAGALARRCFQGRFPEAKQALAAACSALATDALAHYGQALNEGKVRPDTLPLSACQLIDKALLLQGEATVIMAHERKAPALNDQVITLEAMLDDPAALTQGCPPVTDKASLDRAAGIPPPPDMLPPAIPADGGGRGYQTLTVRWVGD